MPLAIVLGNFFLVLNGNTKEIQAHRLQLNSLPKMGTHSFFLNVSINPWYHFFAIHIWSHFFTRTPELALSTYMRVGIPSYCTNKFKCKQAAISFSRSQCTGTQAATKFSTARKAGAPSNPKIDSSFLSVCRTGKQDIKERASDFPE